MNYSMMNETLAAIFCILITWSFGIWVFFEWSNYEVKSKRIMASILAIAIPVAGSIFPVYYLGKCYYQYVLHHLSAQEVASISVDNAPLTGDITPLISSLNEVEWFVPSEPGNWSRLVRAGGAPMVIQEKGGKKYKFKVGYYFLGEALVKIPTGGYALSRSLPKVLEDLGHPLP